MNAAKETLALLRAFSATSDQRFRLLIAGSFSSEIKGEAKRLVAADQRIVELGFLDGDGLMRALCATDLYLQPGTASQTSQTALCCGTPIVVRRLEIYRDLLTAGGFLIDGVDELPAVFETVSAFPERLSTMSQDAYEVARSRLDYRALFLQLQTGRMA